MHLDRWREVVDQIRDNFQVEEHEKLTSEADGGEATERIVFSGPLGRMKLEFISRPKVIDKKTIYSNRIGSETVVEYTYSPDEKVYQLLIYRWSEADGEWLPFENQGMFN